MAHCKQCNQPIKEDANFCQSCGYNYGANPTSQNRDATFLIVLCVLTIVGSALTILRAYFYEIISELDSHNTYIRGWIYGASAIGTLIGAIIMIQRKLNGLYIYTVSQVIYIITVIVASFSYGDFNDLASFIAMFFLIPSIAFLVLYWTVTKKDLR